MDSAGGFRVELLGPVEAWVDGKQVALGGPRPRALLAVLALRRGRVVSYERLIDELWGEDPPAQARDTLQVNVSRLRKALTQAGDDADRLVSAGRWLCPAAGSGRARCRSLGGRARAGAAGARGGSAARPRGRRSRKHSASGAERRSVE